MAMVKKNKVYIMYKKIAPFLKTLYDLGSYIFDLYTDIDLGIYHLYNNDPWWGYLTIIFIMPPMLVAWKWCIGIVSEHRKWSRLSKCFLVILCIICFPLTPIVLLLRGCVAAAKGGRDPNDDAFIAPQVVKLWEAIADAYPQAFLQMYVVGQKRLLGIGATDSQLRSIITSILLSHFSDQKCFC
ncbi:unnamed protein product [Meganyctiphanes norvegica]|uniref:XK-related protein n=1 Tax=Meganyctiphanes norvegica TaxID=48144 RepID=A0AAV2RQT1_MEGNR